MRNIGYSILGKGPQRWRASTKKVYQKRPSELHEALCSLGLNDKTSRLSDAEFAGQVVDEIGYLTRFASREFCNAARPVVNLLDRLVERLFD